MSPAQSPDAEFDRRMMARALRLARRGEGRVEPNPMVGCVIVGRGRSIAEGRHRRFGGPHAETDALRRCRSDPHGTTVYVSLEPCCHVGKTPPCVDALIEARVRRVVVAMLDPHPLVGGRGVRRLRAAGIVVDVGVMRDEATELLAPYLTRIRAHRPYVIAKWAQSLDGKLATRTGDSRWISGEPARRRVHRLRARVDAILVGSSTVLADNPRLTARNVPVRRTATRVVADSRLRISLGCRLVKTARRVPTVVLTSKGRTESPRSRRLRSAGVDVAGCRQRDGRLSPEAMLRELETRDVTNLLIEGGATLLSSFLRRGLVDEALVFVSPRLIGDRRAPAILSDTGAGRLGEAIAPRVERVTRVGPDVCYRLRFS